MTKKELRDLFSSKDGMVLVRKKDKSNKDSDDSKSSSSKKSSGINSTLLYLAGGKGSATYSIEKPSSSSKQPKSKTPQLPDISRLKMSDNIPSKCSSSSHSSRHQRGSNHSNSSHRPLLSPDPRGYPPPGHSPSPKHDDYDDPPYMRPPSQHSQGSPRWSQGHQQHPRDFSHQPTGSNYHPRGSQQPFIPVPGSHHRQPYQPQHGPNPGYFASPSPSPSQASSYQSGSQDSYPPSIIDYHDHHSSQDATPMSSRQRGKQPSGYAGEYNPSQHHSSNYPRDSYTPSSSDHSGGRPRPNPFDYQEPDSRPSSRGEEDDYYPTR